MYITEMDKVNLILETARKASLLPEDIIKDYIDDWIKSPQRHMMLAGQRYYNNDNDINRRKRMAIGEDGNLIEDTRLTNTKLNHAFTRKLVDQKAQYLLGKPMSIQCKNDQYAKILNDYFDKPMLKKLKNVCKELVNKGIAWQQVYIDGEGNLKFKKIPSEQIIPVWTDDDHEDLSAVIRLYDVETYEGRTKKSVTKVEYWTTEGVTYYTLYNGRLIVDVERESGPHFFRQLDKKRQGMLWARVPFVYYKYNEEERPLLSFVKAQVDDYDLLLSDDSNNILDNPNATMVIRGFGGTEAGEFRRNLAVYKTIVLDSDPGMDTGVDTLTVPINTTDTLAHLEQVRKDLYETGRGVDTQTDKLGNASGVALKFIYADLDLDCNGIEAELQSGFKMMLFFINTYLQLTGKGDFTTEQVEFILNRDIIINESEAVANCRNSAGIISEETLVANHPFVTDAAVELERLNKEREAQKQQDDYDGFGLDIDDGSK